MQKEKRSVAENFRDEWQMMGCFDTDAKRARRILLSQDDREVRHEMIYQEVIEGKTQAQVAEDCQVSKSTVQRIMAERRKQ